MHASKQHQFIDSRALIAFVKHLSFYDKCSMTNSPPSIHLITLFSREVEPHYLSTRWESLYPIPWEVLTPQPGF